jgi:hypothetical protein
MAREWVPGKALVSIEELVVAVAVAVAVAVVVEPIEGAIAERAVVALKEAEWAEALVRVQEQEWALEQWVEALMRVAA